MSGLLGFPGGLRGLPPCLVHGEDALRLHATVPVTELLDRLEPVTRRLGCVDKLRGVESICATVRATSVSGQHNGSLKAVVAAHRRDARRDPAGLTPVNVRGTAPHGDRNRSSGPVQQLQKNARSHDGHPRRLDP